jgi:hypothetical protein
MNPGTLIRDLAGAINAQERFARNGCGVLYVHRGGVYRPDGELPIRQRVKHLLLDYDCSEMWSRRPGRLPRARRACAGRVPHPLPGGRDSTGLGSTPTMAAKP